MRRILTLCAAITISGAASAQPAPPDYGFNFVTIGDVGNAGYTGLDPFRNFTGRGRVDYEYRIARTEVTSAQYAEFLNARIDADLDLNPLFAPLYGGVVYNPAADRWGTLPGGEMLPIGGVSWQTAAVFMNWLHNDKGTDPEDFLSGAYDTSTFGRDPNDPSSFTDQSTRSPGARFWIPSLDEWTKAAHWDPNRFGPGQGGYWEFNNSSDTQPVPGLPGVGETSADMDIEDEDAFLIPLESYAQTRSPWGLLDLSGGGAEWTEEWFTQNNPGERQVRYWQGAGGGYTTISPGEDNFDPILGIDRTTDRIWEVGGTRPDLTFNVLSFRIASAVPAPGVGAALLVSGALAGLRRKR